MKKFLIYFSILVTGTLVISSCKKETDTKAVFTSAESGAFVRIIHAAPFVRQTFGIPDSLNVIINNVKANGPWVTYAGQFPASGTNFGYASVPSGLLNVKLTAGGIVNTDSIPLTLFTKVVNVGQYYTIIITNNVKSTNDSSRIILQDNYTKPSNGNYSIRFVHAVLNDTVGKNIDVYSTRRNANIYNNIKPGQIVNFQNFPYNSQLSDTLYVRRAGTLQNLVQATGSFGNQRAYTLIFRGDANLTTGTKVRTLASYLHQ